MTYALRTHIGPGYSWHYFITVYSIVSAETLRNLRLPRQIAPKISSIKFTWCARIDFSPKNMRCDNAGRVEVEGPGYQYHITHNSTGLNDRVIYVSVYYEHYKSWTLPKIGHH